MTVIVWASLAFVLEIPLFFIGLRFQDWLEAEVRLKEEELRGMRAHHRNNFRATYIEGEEL